MAHSSRRVIARNFLSLSVASIAQRVVNLFSGIYIRRVLEVAVIGQVSWCASVLSYFSLAINPGLETIAKRDVAREPGKAGYYVSVLLSLQLLLAMAGFVLAGTLAALNLRGPQVSLILTLQAFGLLLLPLNLTWLLQAHDRMAPAAYAEALSQFLMLPALLLLVHSPSHVARYVLLGYPFRIGSIVFLVWYATHHRLVLWKDLRLGLHGAVALLRQALPLGLSQVAVLLYYNFDAIFLGVIWGDATVGLYSTAYHLMLMPLFLSGSLLTAYFPSLARAQGNLPEMQRVSREFLRIIVWVGFPIAALGWAVGRHVVCLLYGPAYSTSGPLLEWLSLNIALVFFNVGISQPFNAWGQQKPLFYITLAAALLNIGLNCLWIPRYGAWAAVATTLASEVVVLIASLLWRKRICPIQWLPVTGKPLVCAVLIAFLVRTGTHGFPHFWWISLTVGLAMFLCCFWWGERQLCVALLGPLRGCRRWAVVDKKEPHRDL